MSRKLSVIVVLILTVTATSCMLFRKRGPVPNDEPVTLSVVNHNWNDIVIYALIDGTRMRVGDVTASRSATIKLPGTLTSSSRMLQLMLDPLGGRAAFRTGNILVNGGQEVRLTIENELRLTSWSVH